MGNRAYALLTFILCILGLLASLYAYHVETSKENDSTYQAACDISERISCSKVFTSRYGRGFGLLEFVTGRDHVLNQPNSVFGVVFYLLQLALCVQNTAVVTSIALALSVVAMLGCVYLAFILYFVLEDFCVVCVSTYVINFFVLLVTFFRRKHVLKILHRRSAKKSK